MKALDRELQRQRIAKALPYIPPGSSVLDIGCSDGAFLRRRGRPGGQGCRHRPPGAGSWIEGPYDLRVGEFPDVLDTGQTFDAVVRARRRRARAAEGLEAWAAAIPRPARLGGRLIITTPSPKVDEILHVLNSRDRRHGGPRALRLRPPLRSRHLRHRPARAREANSLPAGSQPPVRLPQGLSRVGAEPRPEQLEAGARRVRRGAQHALRSSARLRWRHPRPGLRRSAVSCPRVIAVRAAVIRRPARAVGRPAGGRRARAPPDRRRRRPRRSRRPAHPPAPPRRAPGAIVSTTSPPTRHHPVAVLALVWWRWWAWSAGVCWRRAAPNWSCRSRNRPPRAPAPPTRPGPSAVWEEAPGGRGRARRARAATVPPPSGGPRRRCGGGPGVQRLPAGLSHRRGRGRGRGRARRRPLRVNLAAVLADGQQVVVLRPGEAPPAAAGASPPARASTAAGEGDGALVDINRASAVELEELPGSVRLRRGDHRPPRPARAVHVGGRPARRAGHRRGQARAAARPGDGVTVCRRPERGRRVVSERS